MGLTAIKGMKGGRVWCGSRIWPPDIIITVGHEIGGNYSDEKSVERARSSDETI